LVGGGAETLAKVKVVLLSIGGSVHHVGSIGQGMSMKLAINALFGIQVAALAEIIGMLNRSGVASTQAMACLGDLPVTSLAAKAAGGLMVANNHAPMFPIELVAKDFSYALQTATAIDTSMPATTAICQVYQDAIAKGYGRDNITGVAQLFSPTV
ncbi:MAG: NAD-binding protein, partial [Cyanobacteria bacterium P01_D01_bin.2]